jgi:HEAT repeat protein
MAGILANPTPHDDHPLEEHHACRRFRNVPGPRPFPSGVARRPPQRRQGGARRAWAELGLALKAAAPDLTELARDPRPEVRLLGVQALKQLGEQVQAALSFIHAGLKESALKETDPAIRAEAELALSRDLEPLSHSQVPVLIAALKDELASVRFSAAAALADVGPPANAATASLIRLAMWDQSLRVRVQAAAALWRIDRRDRLAVPVLIEGVQSDDEHALWIAADCLGDIGPEAREAVPALREALGRPCKHPMIRQSVVLALERINAT